MSKDVYDDNNIKREEQMCGIKGLYTIEVKVVLIQTRLF